MGTFFVLLMYFGDPDPTSLKEFTIRDSLSECLSAKRTIQRSLRGGISREYSGTVRVQCKELTVEHDDKMNIIKIMDNGYIRK